MLTVPGSVAVERTKLPQIAPTGMAGIRSARAVQSGDDVLVRMFVDSGVTLRATPLGNEVVIEAQNETPSTVASNPAARAQYGDQPARAQGGG